MKYILPTLTALMVFSACENSNNKPLAEGSFAIVENRIMDSSMMSLEERMNLTFTSEDSLADAAVRGYDINLVSGKLMDGGKTTLEYMNTLQLLNATRKKRQKEQATTLEADLSERLVKKLQGGQVYLYISQPSIGAVDFKSLSLVIQDTSGVELFRKDLRDQTAQGHSGVDNLWWIQVEKRIRPPFLINVVDRVNTDKSLKYLVKAVK